MNEIPRNPFVGPRAFTESEAELYFGRDREAEDLLSLVISSRMVLFHAQSGAGKSSLLNTRLVPGLRNEGFEVLPIGRVGGEAPTDVEVGNIFIFNLLATLDGGASSLQALAQMPLSEYLQGRETGIPPSRQEASYDDEDVDEIARVLVIDQFEEILTSHLENWQARDEFFKQLKRAYVEDPLLWVVLVMREDFVAALDPYLRLLPDRLRSRFYMQRLRADNALKAVKYPAETMACPFAQGVAEALVRNLRQLHVRGRPEPIQGEFVEPVHLQVVCFQLWQNLLERGELPAEITHEDLDSLGDVDSALAQFYEAAVRLAIEKVGGSELKVHQWFQTKLITEAGTRGTVYRGEDQTSGLDNDIVDILARQFLIKPDKRAGGTWYELSHDRFIQPIQKAYHSWWQRQSALLQAAHEWDQTGRSKTYLYYGEQLEQALALSINQQTLEPIVDEFLLASQILDDELQEEVKVAAQLRRRAWLLTVTIGGVVCSYGVLLALFLVTEHESANIIKALAAFVFGVLLPGVVGGMLTAGILFANHLFSTQHRARMNGYLKILNGKLISEKQLFHYIRVMTMR